MIKKTHHKFIVMKSPDVYHVKDINFQAFHIDMALDKLFGCKNKTLQARFKSAFLIELSRYDYHLTVRGRMMYTRGNEHSIYDALCVLMETDSLSRDGKRQSDPRNTIKHLRDRKTRLYELRKWRDFVCLYFDSVTI